MAKEIGIAKAKGVLELTLQRPSKRNAITAAMYGELATAIIRAQSDGGTKVVIIAGEGGSFTAGNDLEDFVGATRDPIAPAAEFMAALSSLEKPLVAAVDGLAVGIGTTMLLHCDVVVASKGARFMLPFINLGLVPEFASSMLLPGLIGRRAAARHLMFADPFDAKQALEYGIVSHLADEDSAIVEARRLADVLSAKAPEALRDIKRLLQAPSETVPARIARETAVFRDRLASPESKEAMQALREKRAPVFSDTVGPKATTSG